AHHGRGAWASGIAHLVATGVLVLPLDLAVGGVQAHDALDELFFDESLLFLFLVLSLVFGLRRFLDVLAIQHVDDALSHGRAAVAFAQRDAPAHLRPILGK